MRGRLARLRRGVMNGARCRCPRCGDGRLFRGWTRMRERCPECDLLYLENPGDPWGFLLVLDRGVFILPPIALLYLGWVPRSLPGLVVLFVGLAAALFASTPHRYGICVGIDWATRSQDGRS